MLIGLNNKKAIIMQAKEVLVRAHAFPLLPVVYGIEYQPTQGSAHSSITKTIVGKALFYQSVKKVSGLNMHNFRILNILWD